MNTPTTSSAGTPSSIPAYRKWYFGSTAKPMPRGMRASPEPDPLPFEEIHEHDEITVGPPSTSADGHSAHGYFTIPEGADGKKLYGTCSLFLGVDDWGSLEVKDSSGSVVAQVDLKKDSQTAGKQGGHKYHTGTGGAQLPSGSYIWEVNQTNIDYKPEKTTSPSATIASTWCRRSREARRSPRSARARETRVITAAERRLPRRWPGRAPRWGIARWETTPPQGAV